MTPLAWGLLGLGGAWMALQGVADRLVYPRSRTFRAQAGDAGLPVEELEFCAEDGTALHGWWFPRPQSRGVLICCHGNAGNISDRLWMARDLQDLPLDIFIFDYRGYGKSEGLPSEKGTGRDVRAAYELAHARLGYPENPPIFVYGRSLGGAVALQLAETHALRAIVLESTFSSILDIGLQRYPWLLPRLSCRNPYRSDLRIAQVTAPLLIAHSPDDEIVPYDMGRRLFDLATAPKRFVTLQGTHAEAGWQTSPEYAAAFREWILARL
jgi:pimeloyl-ACP methyl ester carboxylesterase